MKMIEFLTFFDGKVIIGGKAYNFGEKSIGFKRHYAARTAGNQISRVIYIPYTQEVSNGSLAIIDGKTFIIDMIQPTKSTKPHSTVLTLIDYGVSSNGRK